MRSATLEIAPTAALAYASTRKHSQAYIQIGSPKDWFLTKLESLLGRHKNIFLGRVSSFDARLGRGGRHSIKSFVAASKASE
jgi:hypothetical protein